MDLRTAWSNRVLHSDILGRGTFIGECFHLFSSVYLNDSALLMGYGLTMCKDIVLGW